MFAGGAAFKMQMCIAASNLQRQLSRLTASRRLSKVSLPLACRVGKAASCACVAASAVASISSAAPRSSRNVQSKALLRDFGKPSRRATDTMLVVNMVMFMLQKLSRDVLTVFGAKITAAVLAGQFWRLFTAGVLHSSVVHLLVNMYTLNAVGPHLEELGGRQRFAAVYAAGSLGGICASCLLAPEVISIGSSCALFGLFGAIGTFYWRHRALLKQRSRQVFNAMAVTMAMNAGLALVVPKLDHWGHAGGLLGGVVAAWLLGPHLVPVAADSPYQGWYEDRPPWPVLALDVPVPTVGAVGGR